MVSIGFLVAMVTDYVKVITKTYLTIILLSNDTMLLSLSDTEWFYNAIKGQGLQTIENVGSHLKRLNGTFLNLPDVLLFLTHCSSPSLFCYFSPSLLLPLHRHSCGVILFGFFGVWPIHSDFLRCIVVSNFSCSVLSSFVMTAG